MSAAVLPAAAPAPAAPAGPHPLLGRTFLHPALDYLVIGGGASLLLAAAFALDRDATRAVVDPVLPAALVGVGYAHFAASSVRLYSRPGATAARPFLAFGLPLVCLAALSAVLAVAADWGRHLNMLYLAWSPYHYSAQAYGLALIYAHRSGCTLLPGEKGVLRWACFLPFLHSLFVSAAPVWLLGEAMARDPRLPATLLRLGLLLKALSAAAPMALCLLVWRRRGQFPPLMLPLLVVSNAAWLLVFGSRLDAFAWAAMAHGLQYLGIALVYHVREGRRGAPLRSAAAFYALCLPLGYVLFQVWPWAFVAAGFGRVESAMLVTAMVNIHHFVVDAYVWRRP